MKVLFCLNHPAHYHLCKNTIANLKFDGHEVHILARPKDVLLDLLKNEQYDVLPIKKGKTIIEKIKLNGPATRSMMDYIKKLKPDFVTGTGNFQMVTRKFGIPTFLLAEDDVTLNWVLFLDSFMTYSGFTGILSPESCNNSVWEKKTVHYAGFHKLAYLHPNRFTPNKAVVEKYFSTEKPYFVLRLAKLNAYHDINASGINSEIAQHIINLLEPYGDVYITAERELEPQFEKYRLQIDPLDIHHLLAYATLYLGDSQSMAVEAAMLGTPSIRFNDFVGKIGVLKELDNKYGLSYGVKSNNPEKLYKTIEEILAMPNLREEFQQRRQKMLADKIDVTAFFTWFIENYPESLRIMKDNPDYQYNFR